MFNLISGNLTKSAWAAVLILCLCGHSFAEEGAFEAEGGKVWQLPLAGFEQADYRSAVSDFFLKFEAHSGRSLVAGSQGMVGLKVFTAAGGGIATPRALVKAVIDELVCRGFAEENIILWDQYENFLRQAGFLPPRSKGGDRFYGARVMALENEAFYDALWFHDSPLPPPSVGLSEVAILMGRRENAKAVAETDRRSYLPIPLFQKMDFWINLPVAMDHPKLGMRGALTNVTLSNASNTRRFWQNPASGAVAVAEMAAIPELREKWIFTLMSLERYQFVGGPSFNSYYTRSEPLLLGGTNPVLMDYLLYQRMNRERKKLKLPEIEPRPLIFDYCSAIGLGELRPEKADTLDVE